jgi:hypothetical protein
MRQSCVHTSTLLLPLATRSREIWWPLLPSMQGSTPAASCALRDTQHRGAERSRLDGRRRVAARVRQQVA